MKREIFVWMAVLLSLWTASAGADPVSTGVVVSTPLAPASEPWLWPVSKTIGNQKVKIVSVFGLRKSPAPDQKPERHTGCDFNVPPDAAVKAARAGKVIFAGFSSEYVSRADKTDKSRLVIVKHPDGTSSRYVHLNVLKVTPGMQVSAGQLLGKSAESDEWSVPVLHFEIRDASGRPQNPEKFFAAGKAQ